MDDLTWTVVQFLEDLTVEAIPTSWIQGDFCHWPPYKQDKLTNSIKKCEPLNTNWPRHAVKIFRNGTFDEYGKARSKARVAEDCSDLNSATDSPTGKRKRIQRVLSSSSSDDSIDNSFKLPPPPKISKSANPSPPKPHSSRFTGNNMSFIFNQTTSEDSVDIQSKSVYESRLQATHNVNQITSEDCIDINSNKVEKKIQATHTVKAVPSSVGSTAAKSKSTGNQHKEISSENQNQSCASGSHCCLKHENAVLIEIKNQNHMIRSILTDVLKEIQDLKITKPDSDTPSSIFLKYDIQFPITNDADLNKFEEELKIEQNFNEAVNELAKFGGSNPYNFIKRTISAVINDNMLVNYSWLGRKGKKPLEKSPVAKLLICAADKCLDATRKEVEGAIQSFLKRSRERLTAKENKKK